MFKIGFMKILTLFVLITIQFCVNSIFSQKKDFFNVKIDPISIVSWENYSDNNDFSTRARINQFLIGVEVKNNSKISSEIELGLTRYVRHYKINSLFGEMNGSQSYYNFVHNQPYYVHPLTGFLCSYAIRYYLKTSFDGFYISPKIKYCLLNDIIVSNNGLATKKEKNSALFGTFNLGCQKKSKNGFVFDFYVGFGFKFKTNNNYSFNWLVTRSDGTTYESDSYINHSENIHFNSNNDKFIELAATSSPFWHLTSLNDFKPYSNFGVKIGWGK